MDSREGIKNGRHLANKRWKRHAFSAQKKARAASPMAPSHLSGGRSAVQCKPVLVLVRPASPPVGRPKRRAHASGTADGRSRAKHAPADANMCTRQAGARVAIDNAPRGHQQNNVVEWEAQFNDCKLSRGARAGRPAGRSLGGEAAAEGGRRESQSGPRSLH